jgi:hypothetical protein
LSAFAAVLDFSAALVVETWQEFRKTSTYVCKMQKDKFFSRFLRLMGNKQKGGFPMSANADEIATNRKYKNSVFTKLFGTPEKALELYNAISGKNYPPNTKIKIVTLSDVLYMEQLNDISFVIDGKLVVLIEHQSSINENMPLRMLMYIAREYELLTNGRDLYKEHKIKIPTPEFVVLYNGEKEMGDFVEMKLSDSFELAQDFPNLDLVVKVYNINKGRNAEMAAKSSSLSGYEEFIAAVRENQKSMSLKEAIRVAIRSCVSSNILVEFLTEHGSEVEDAFSRMELG